MPSDELTRTVLAALRPASDRFRSALAATGEELRDAVTRLQAGSAGDVAVRTAELGGLAHLHLDLDRLAEVAVLEAPAEAGVLEVLERAWKVCEQLAARDEGAQVIELPNGWDLRDAVRGALRDWGRAIGAAHAVDAARRGVTLRGVDGLLEGYEFERWNHAERQLAPPIVVRLAGADLRPAGLADYLDGTVKIVLLVEGSPPLAPMARLITPGVFVAQTDDRTVVERLAAYEGPGAVALVGDPGPVRFVHDPSAGPTIAERLALGELPAEPRPARVGASSAAQQLEELTLLRDLVLPRVTLSPTGPPAQEADPADKLAAWLLAQADLAS